jgi:predicted DNA-binding protein (UPF0251 family)
VSRRKKPPPKRARKKRAEPDEPPMPPELCGRQPIRDFFDQLLEHRVRKDEGKRRTSAAPAKTTANAKKSSAVVQAELDEERAAGRVPRGKDYERINKLLAAKGNKVSQKTFERELTKNRRRHKRHP